MTAFPGRPFCEPGTPERWLRPHPVRITHVELSVTIDLPTRRISGVVSHHCEILDPSEPAHAVLTLDSHDLEIGPVTVDGQARVAVQSHETLVIDLGPGPERRVVSIPFSVTDPAKGMYFIAADPQRDRVAMCWTQGAMEDHSWWFPCLDSPNNRATYRVSMRHATGLRAVSNGICLGTSDAADGWSTTVYDNPQPFVLYLLNLVIGELTEVTEAPTIPALTTVGISHVVPRGRQRDAQAMFRATAFAIGYLSTTIGHPYPWPRYGHVVVHGFMWGGMENTGLTTISDRFLMDATVQEREDVNCDPLVVHELVHQWFGDLLTMKGWSDIWLNESFATYLEARGQAAWIAHRDGGGAQRYQDELALHQWADRRAYLEEDGGRYRRALVTNRYADAYELFDRVAYEKGSLVLHHLAQVLGEARFHRALALYVSRHAYGLVETADWRQAIEDATGEPLDWFFAQWVYRAGHPRLKVRWSYDPARAQATLTVEQLQAAGGEVATQADRLYRLPTELWWRDGEVVHQQRIELTALIQTIVLPSLTPPAWVVVDPHGHVLCDWEEEDGLGVARARLNDARLPAVARARAAVVLATRSVNGPVIAELATLAADASVPELVRHEAIATLAGQQTAAATQALRALMGPALPARLRRSLVQGLARSRVSAERAALADWLIAQGDQETSLVTAGECYAARGAIEQPGATPLLRARLRRDSWNQRLRIGCVRGLGLSGEAAAIDEVLALAADDAQIDAVIVAACEAAGRLGARHVLGRVRIRAALERRLDHPALAVRASAARALGGMGEELALGALQGRLGRERFGNVHRVLREAISQLQASSAQSGSIAELQRRLEESEKGRARLEARLDAIERRLDAPPG